MTDKEKLDYLKQKMNQKVTNEYIAIRPSTDENGKIIHTCQWYRHPDLYQFSKEAFLKDQQYFYAEPEDPTKPYGSQKLSEPKYKYSLSMNQQEYDIIFGEDNYDR